MIRADEFNTGVIRPVQCYREAWDLIKPQYWITFAVVLVGLIVGGIIPVIIMGPMICGIYLCLLDGYHGKPISFERLFKGFDLFVPGLILSLIVMVPVFVLMIVLYIPMIAFALTGPRMDEGEIATFFIGFFIFEFFAILVMVCIHTLMLFSFPLLVDRGVSAWRSVTLSARAVWANLGGIASLMGVGFLVALAGYLMLCVGVYLTLPLIFAANTVAYRKIFPAATRSEMMPPPPQEYREI